MPPLVVTFLLTSPGFYPDRPQLPQLSLHMPIKAHFLACRHAIVGHQSPRFTREHTVQPCPGRHHNRYRLRGHASRSNRAISCFRQAFFNRRGNFNGAGHPGAAKSCPAAVRWS